MSNKSDFKIKNMRTYIEDDYLAAYSKARRELGADLVIIEKIDVKVGGILGCFQKRKLK